MPIFEYSCPKCHKTTERIYKITHIPKTIKCECGHTAKKILSRGNIQTDSDIKWLPSASEALVKHHEKPLETRTEYKDYLKKNGLEPVG